MVQMVSNQMDKMREAADQLVKAALDEATITRPIVSLREGLDSGFESQNSVLKSIVQSTESLKSGVADLKEQLILQSKHRALEWALSNCTLNSFEYYDRNNHSYQPLKSSDIARLCLLSFRTGFGSYINDRSIERTFNDETERKFREKLQEQLFELLGKKPRLAKVEKFGWAIYYE